MLFLILADVDVSASILSICNWVIGLGLALGTVALVGVGIMFIFSFDNPQQGRQARMALVSSVLGMIILYGAAGLATVVKAHIVGA